MNIKTVLMALALIASVFLTGCGPSSSQKADQAYHREVAREWHGCKESGKSTSQFNEHVDNNDLLEFELEHVRAMVREMVMDRTLVKTDTGIADDARS